MRHKYTRYESTLFGLMLIASVWALWLNEPLLFIPAVIANGLLVWSRT